MRKILILMIAGIAVLLFSCATPPEQPEPPVDTTVPLPEQELAEAKSLKSTVDNFGLSEFAAQEYREAENSFQEGQAAYGKDNAKAKSALDRAIVSYRGVIEKAFTLKVDRSKAEVDKIKANAEAIKAQVAVKEEYAAAKAKYDAAEAARAGGDFEQAISLFDEAKALFQNVYEQTRQKKEAAEAEMKSSQDSLKDAEERAKAGDEEIQGGGQ
jgi:tetratricopeptide (TPR) repeat protein